MCNLYNLNVIIFDPLTYFVTLELETHLFLLSVCCRRQLIPLQLGQQISPCCGHHQCCFQLWLYCHRGATSTFWIWSTSEHPAQPYVPVLPITLMPLQPQALPGKLLSKPLLMISKLDPLHIPRLMFILHLRTQVDIHRIVLWTIMNC